MLQNIDGRDVYVVEFDTMPSLPISWSTEEEKPYALALAHAIHTAVITKPGKYGLYISSLDYPMLYSAYTIKE